jgi:hypothetical protein
MAVNYITLRPSRLSDDSDFDPTGPGATLLSGASAEGPLGRALQRSARTFWADNAGPPDEREARNAAERFRGSFASAWRNYSQQTDQDAIDGFDGFHAALDASRDKILSSVSGGARDILEPVLDRLHLEGAQIGLAHWDRHNRAALQRLQMAQAERNTMSDVPDNVIGSQGQTQVAQNTPGSDLDVIDAASGGKNFTTATGDPTDIVLQRDSFGRLSPGSDYVLHRTGQGRNVWMRHDPSPDVFQQTVQGIGDGVGSTLSWIWNLPSRVYERAVDPSKRLPDGPRNAVDSAVAILGGVAAGRNNPRTAQKDAAAGAIKPPVELDPHTIKYSQTSVNGSKEMIESMQKNGWNGPPIDVVRMGGNLVTYDNTRVVAARQVGINVRANIHEPSEPFPPERWGTRPPPPPATWGDAMGERFGRQNRGFRDKYPNGSPEMENIK